MRVLHVHAPGPEPPILARYQNLLGIQARLITKGPTTYHGWRALLALRLFRGVDVVNYHSYVWLWRPRPLRHLDVRVARLSGAKVCFTFQGSDLRETHFYLPLKEFFTETNVSVYNPDLIEFVPEARWMPYAIDTQRWLKTPNHGKGWGFTVGFYDRPDLPHIYLHRNLVPQAAEIMKKKGFNIELKPCFRIPPENMEAYYDSLDVYVDIRSFGWYGDGPCEAALRGVSPITYVPERFLHLVNSREFFLRVEPNPQALAEALISLAEDEAFRRKAAEEAKAYVLKKHDAWKVAKVFQEWYEELS